MTLLTKIKEQAKNILLKSEKYFKTDMLYLAKGSFWLNLNLILGSIFSFLLSIAFATFLTKETYGTYQFVLSAGSIIGAFTLTGINTAVAQAIARGYEGGVTSTIKTQLRYSIFSFLIAISLAAYYFLHGNSTIAISLLIVSICIPLSTTFNTYTALWGGRRDFKTSFFYSQAQNLPYYILMVVVLYLSRSPIYIVLANFGLNSVIAVLLYFSALRNHKPNRKDDESTISYGKHLSLSNIINLISGQLDKILIYHYIGAAELAIYAFATIIPERLIGGLKSISTVAFPKLSLKDRREIGEEMVPKTIRFGIGALVLSLLYILVSPLIFHLFFPKYLDSIFLSQAYSLIIVITLLASLPQTALTATKSIKEIYIYNTSSSIFNIITMFVMISSFGIWGIIISKGISGIFNYSLLIFMLKK